MAIMDYMDLNDISGFR